MVGFANFFLKPEEKGEKRITVSGSWFRGFMKRHKDILSVRKVEARSKQRVLCARPVTVAHFYVVLGRLFREYAVGVVTRSGLATDECPVCTLYLNCMLIFHKLMPIVAAQFISIINTDECGCDTQSGRFTKKCIVRRGEDTVFVPVAGERGKHITIIVSVCTNLPTVPVTIILCGSKNSLTEEQLLTYGEGSIVTSTDNGWSNQEIFLEVVKSILHHVESHNEEWAKKDVFNRKPLLILMDGHTSHYSLDIIMFCMSNSILLVRSPAHCTHILQVLDSHELFGAFQTKLRGYVQAACSQGDIVDNSTFGTHFTKAWNDVFTNTRRIRRVFEEYGIYPFNPQRLDVTKLRQQAPLRAVFDRQRMIEEGVDPDTAMLNGRNSNNTTLSEVFQYTEQWETDIQQYFENAIAVPATETPETERIRRVNESYIGFQLARTPSPAAKKVHTRDTKRTRKALRQQAAHLTVGSRLQDLKQKVKQLKEGELMSARRTEYETKYKVDKAAVDKLNKENVPKRKNARKTLTRAKNELKTAKRSLKQTVNSLSKRRKGSDGTTLVSDCAGMPFNDLTHCCCVKLWYNRDQVREHQVI